MEPNDKSSLESRQKELLDMAYNKVPEGAEYDVFSENTREATPSLLYDDIPSVISTEIREEQRDEIGEPYDIFAENDGTVKPPEQNLEREYLNVLYPGGIDLSKDEIRMTRSQYVAEYNEINEYYDKEKRKTILNFLWIVIIAAFGLSVLKIIELFQVNTNVYILPRVVNPLYRLWNGLRAGAFVATPVICGAFFVSMLKRIKKIKISQKKALKRLEEKKQELMLSGLYDTAN